MAYDAELLKADILAVLKQSFPKAVDAAADLTPELQSIASDAATYAIAAQMGSPEAKDILRILKARSLTLGAVIAGREQTVVNDTLWRVVEAVMRFAGLAVRVAV